MYVMEPLCSTIVGFSLPCEDISHLAHLLSIPLFRVAFCGVEALIEKGEQGPSPIY